MDQKTAVRQLKELERLGRGKPMRLAGEGWREAARTRDETTVFVAEELFSKYKTLSALAGAKPEEMSAIIGPVNFFQNKTKYVIALAKVLVERYKGVPPRDIQKLIELPGVGRKTANVFLSEYGADAIGVDTHVAYISQRLGWTN